MSLSARRYEKKHADENRQAIEKRAGVGGASANKMVEKILGSEED